MTVLYPERFKEAQPAGFDGLFEWDFLKPAFHQPNREKQIEPMDLDCLVERRMRFLGFETKNAGVKLPDGQRITLESLVKTGFFIIIVLRAKTAEEIQGWEVWHLGGKSKTVIKKSYDGDSDDLTDFATRWFKWASKRGYT